MSRRHLSVGVRSVVGLSHSLVVIAALALVMGLVPQANAATAPPPTRPITWLAVGDSYASGMGVLSDKGDTTCARSQYSDAADKTTVNGKAATGSNYQKAWAPAAKDILAATDPGFAVSNFVFSACSSSTRNEFFSPGPSSTGRPQQWNGTTKYDLITMTFGGNDVGVIPAVLKCSGISPSGWKINPDLDKKDPLTWFTKVGCDAKSVLNDQVNWLMTGNSKGPGIEKQSFADFLAQVADQAVNPGGAIVVVGYPDFISDPSFWPSYQKNCVGISRSDATTLRDLARTLNGDLATSVDQLNANKASHKNITFTFVDVNTGQPDYGVALDNPNLYEPTGTSHNLCSANSWIHGIIVNPTVRASFHPTADGYANTAQLVAQRIQQIDWSGLGK